MYEVFQLRYSYLKKTASTTRSMKIDFFSPKRDVYRFSESELMDCFKMITDRLANIEYHSTIDYVTTRELFAWTKKNHLQIIRRVFYDGYFILNSKTMEFVDITTRALNTLSGVITFDLKEDEVLITSDTFEATGRSDSFYAKNKCSFPGCY